MPFFDLKRKLASEIADYFNSPDIKAEALAADAGVPPQLALGHLALPCFKLSKVLKQPSDMIAKSLTEHFSGKGITVTPTGPYANFKWDVGYLYSTTLESIFTKKARYGSDDSGKNKHIVFEYCSPNVAKKLGFQHIRSTLIGNTLANVYDFLGYQTERINFVGDWGSQFARLLAAFETWGRPELVDTTLPGFSAKAAMDHLFEIYVKFHKECDVHPEYLEQASKCLQRLEEHEARATDLWKKIRKISIAAMDETLERMNIRFNHLEGESTYIPEIQKTLKEVKEKAGAKLSEGAWIVEVPGLTTPALVQKKDGTTLYLTRDIAAAEDREKRFHPDKMFYVVAEQQKLHFQLLFGTLKLMGHEWADNCEHVSFGTVLFGTEKMSTREGRVIFLDELLDEAKALALEECTKKNPDLPNKDEVADMVGVGAIIFGNLSSHRKSDIEFKWETVLALDGETGPYVQYSLVRCHSLLEKAKAKGEKSGVVKDVSQYAFAPEEESLILSLAKLRSTLHLAVRDNEPYHLTYYLIDLAKAFNRFYYKLPVLQSNDPTQRELRLGLVEATQTTLTNGLELLGMRAPKEM